MDLTLVGLSYQTAPIEVRERVAVPEGSLNGALAALQSDFGITEGLLLSTCNRVEIIAGGDHQQDLDSPLKRFLYSYHSLEKNSLDKYLYTYRGRELVQHVFRVASSLDSMVIGEAQILGQLKKAYSLAQQAGATGSSLHQLMSRAFFVAKRVRTETGIARSPVSVSSVAVELARKVFGDLESRTVLLLGAGKMSELAAQSLKNCGSRLLVCNRTAERSQELARRLEASPVPFEELDDNLSQSDIVIVSTGSDSFVLQPERMERVVRARRYDPLFLIDISVPRNVDPEVNKIDEIFLFDIDDLQSVVSINLQERQHEAERAEEIVHEEVHNFLQTASRADVGPLIQSLRHRIEELCLEELDNSRGHLNAEQFAHLERALLRAAHRIAHPLILELKNSAGHLNGDVNELRWIRKIFELDR